MSNYKKGEGKQHYKKGEGKQQQYDHQQYDPNQEYDPNQKYDHKDYNEGSWKNEKGSYYNDYDSSWNNNY